MIQAGQPAVLLAPMEGVIDAPMRAFFSEFAGGVDACVSEFIRISQDPPPQRVFLRHVPELVQGGVTQSGVPVQVQLLGGNPELLAEAAWTACQAGAWGIDLNFGCPAPTVNQHDGGATLLKYPHRIREIVRAVRKAVPLSRPVSAKLRLGWDSMEMIHTNADQVAEGGASWMTIHGRTKVQGYMPPAYWKPIGEVRKRLGLPVIANGEIWTVEDFLKCQEETGCEHFMLGRGALADVDLPRKVREVLLGKQVEQTSPLHSNQQWKLNFERFASVCGSYGMGEGYILRRMKQWAGLASRRWELDWVDPLRRVQTLREVFQLLDR